MRFRAKAGIALLLAAALAACSQPPRVVPSVTPEVAASPSPTVEPTPSPTESPTPQPTVAPTPSPTPRPRPTTTKAGDQILSYYFQARQLFPILPFTPQIDFDEPAEENGNSWYRGINSLGRPTFAVREDFVMTPRTAYHEIGHAFEDVLKRAKPTVDVRAKYWTYRGFPSTWLDAAYEADKQPAGSMAQWVLLPGESWAEAFSVAVVGTGREKTIDYGRTINPLGMRAFFQALATTSVTQVEPATVARDGSGDALDERLGLLYGDLLAVNLPRV